MKDRLIDRFIRFDKLLGITAIVIAFVAAFFSVYGIATLFAGAFTLTAIMASSLEVGKLVAVTFLYRYWRKAQGFLKAYLGIATLVLMLITSLGIFGYLSAAYQKSALEFKAAQEKITMMEGKKTYLQDKVTQSRTRIKTLNDMRIMQESRMNEALTNAFLTRNPIQLKQIQDQTAELIKSADADIKTENDKIQTTADEMSKIDQQVNEMKFASANKKDIRTFQFVAEQFGTTLDKVAKWFIFTIIFVFDPLAIALILAYNVVAYKKPDEHETWLNPQPEPSLPIMQSTNSKKEEKVEIVDSPEQLINVTNSEKVPIVNPPEQPKEHHTHHKHDPDAPRPNWL